MLKSYKKKESTAFWWGFIFIGAFSNLIDRLRWGAVVDYIKIGWWPVFNLSDSLIVVGIAMLLIAEIQRDKKIPR